MEYVFDKISILKFLFWHVVTSYIFVKSLLLVHVGSTRLSQTHARGNGSFCKALQLGSHNTGTVHENILVISQL